MKKKQVIAILMAAAMMAPNTSAFAAIPAAENKTASSHQELSKQLAEESVVLLENGSNTLPLEKGTTVSVFGNTQLSGTTTIFEGLENAGISYYQPLADYYISTGTENHGWGEEDGFIGTDSVENDAEKWGQLVTSGTSWNRPAGLASPEIKLDGGEVIEDGLVAEAAKNSEAAIVILKRQTGTEEMDRTTQAGDWYLNYSERKLLEQVTSKFEKVVVVLEVKFGIDLSWLDEYGIDTVLLSYSSGDYTAQVYGEIIGGMVNPSGKMSDTLMTTYEEYSTGIENFAFTTYEDYGLTAEKNNARFGQEDPVSVYEEDIYLGYKYYDTFGKDVRYAFGSGLSYSDFEFSDSSISVDGETSAVTVTTTITNTTEDDSIVDGKEVMEVYVSKPQGKLEQAYQNLVAFNKTDDLSAGEFETITAQFDLYDIASYDEEQAAYILEPGYYYIRVGSSSRDTEIVGAIQVENEIKVEQLANQCEITEDVRENIDFLSNEGAVPITYEGEEEEKKAAQENAIVIDASYISYREMTAEDYAEYENFTAEELEEDAPVYTLKAVQEGLITLEQFVSQVSPQEMMMLLCGNCFDFTPEQYIQVNVNDKEQFTAWDDETVSYFHDSDAPASGAGLTRSLGRLGVPTVNMSDGASGITVKEKEVEGEEGLYTSPSWPSAAARTCTWNPSLLREFGDAMGSLMEIGGINIWLAPAVNLHRNPLAGRNIEYMSEDAVLTGLSTYYISEEISKHGVAVQLKHFAGNEQEHYRRGYQNHNDPSEPRKDAVDTIVTERNLRENYLKAFEYTIKNVENATVMTAFNRINGVNCAANEDLLIHILREEWGYEGGMTADWGDYDVTPTGAEMLIASNTWTMPGSNWNNSYITQMYEGFEDGTLSEQVLRRETASVMKTLLKDARVFDDTFHFTTISGSTEENAISTWFGDLQIFTGMLPDAEVGKEYSIVKMNPLNATGGHALTYTYSVSENGDALPEGITLAPNGVLSGAALEGTEGTYEVEFVVTTDQGESASKVLSLTVKNEKTTDVEDETEILQGEKEEIEKEEETEEAEKEGTGILTTELPDGAAIAAYDVTLKCSKEDAVFTVESGELPTGLKLSEDGELKGSFGASESGYYTFTVAAVSGEEIYTQEYHLYVNGLLAVTPEAYTTWKVKAGEEFVQQIEIEDGVTEFFKFEIDTKKGTGLPQGLSLEVMDSGRYAQIQGTPEPGSEGSYTVVINMDRQDFAISPVETTMIYTIVVE